MGVTGDRAFAARLRKLRADQVGPALSQALFKTAQQIQVDAQVSITEGSASGTETKKHLHVPSRPGEPPNNFSGHLADNIEAVLVEPLKATVTSHAEYSAHLEYGTSKMLARPFMAPALERNRDTLRKNVKAALKAAIGKAG